MTMSRYTKFLFYTTMRLNSIKKFNDTQRKLYAQRTGFSVDIQSIGKNTRTIAHRAKKSLRSLREGVWISTDILELEDGNFTNVYDLFWGSEANQVAPSIHSEEKPYYLLDHIEKSESIIATINGSFFFLIDVVDREPIDYPFHFCVRDGRVVGLASSSETVLFIKDSKLHAQKIEARGILKINKTIMSWIGSEKVDLAKSEVTDVLYNSGSAKIIKSFDVKTGVRNGELDHDRIHTPTSVGVVDLVIRNNEKGELRVVKINAGGGTHYFEGLFILQIKKQNNQFIVGDLVTPLTLDNTDISSLESAITIGKSVRDPYFFTQERINSRDARSVIAQDVAGNTHFLVFDGSKYIPKFKGVSANDLATYFSQDKYEWAYFLDGGSSSRIIARSEDGLEFMANDFAFRRVTHDVFLWDHKRHRKLASSIELKVKNS